MLNPGREITLKRIYRTGSKPHLIYQLMKRPYEPIPENKTAGEETDSTALNSKREFPKRKVAMILGYSGTGYQGMQRYR